MALDSGAAFDVIGNDAGLLRAPVKTSNLIIGNGERYDIVVDFAPLRAGSRVVLRNLPLPYNDDYPNTDKVMAFDIVADAFSTVDNQVPTVLARNVRALDEDPSASVATRTYEAQRRGDEWTINRVTWRLIEASRFTLVDGTPRFGTVETWNLANPHGGWTHPFHIHGVDFKILSRNGRPPRPYETGPKDTVYVGENESVKVLIRFENAGKYMLHCHNVMHEDDDMMSQFEVIGGSVLAPSPFAAPAQDLPEAPLA
ncbi:MAG: multicopper oxidase domain-containing protein [Actinomycetales bacterium]